MHSTSAFVNKDQLDIMNIYVYIYLHIVSRRPSCVEYTAEFKVKNL